MRTTFTTRDSSRIEICVTLPNKESIPIRFVPPVLFGNVGKSTYTTCNDEIATAIKAHPYFDSIIFLKSEESDVKKVEQEQNTAPTDYAAMCNPEYPIVLVDEVTTVATAAHWLQSIHSAVWSSKKIADIKAEAASKYNTLFPNL